MSAVPTQYLIYKNKCSIITYILEFYYLITDNNMPKIYPIEYSRIGYNMLSDRKLILINNFT